MLRRVIKNHKYGEIKEISQNHKIVEVGKMASDGSE